MIDNNDEYQFADLDVADPTFGDMGGEPGTPSEAAEAASEKPPQKDIRRNALIVVVVVVLAMILYKFLGSFFHKDEAAIEDSKATAPTQVQAFVPPPATPVVVSAPVTPVPDVSPPAPSPDLSDVNQKLSNLEANQQGLRADVNALTSQLSTVANNINSVDTKVSALNQTLAQLATRMEQQSEELTRFFAQQAKPRPVPVVKRRVVTPQRQYYIQAIIPGRAWLIAQNGSTLTVREGTIVPGYGTVRLIDPNQGRVMMSSGQVIRFSQQDS